MHLTTSFWVDEAKLIQEPFADETVLINLETGQYYSLNASGTDIWRLVKKQASVAAIFEGMTTRYVATPETDLEAAIVSFLELLMEENLIEISAIEISIGFIQGVTPRPVTVEQLPFVAPTLTRHANRPDGWLTGMKNEE